jgi:hypothetical protein
MIDLKSIKKGIEKLPPRILLYGVEGIGKSTWATSAPSAIVTVTEDRLSHINCDKFPLANSFEEAMETLRALYAAKGGGYKTHVTDSVDWLEKLIHKKICQEHGESSIISNAKGSELAYGRGYLMAEKIMREYLKGLEALRGLGLTIILVGHEQVKKYDDPMRESYDRYQPNLHERIREMLKQWCDCVFFANYEIVLKKEDQGFGKTENKAIGGQKRFLYTQERPAFDAKNSYDLPLELEMKRDNGFLVFENEFQKWVKKNVIVKKTEEKKENGN